MSIVSALLWVPKGVAAQDPRLAELSDDELDRIAKLTATEAELARDDLAEAHLANLDGANPPVADIDAEFEARYRMSEYDIAPRSPGASDSEDDPYLTLPSAEDLEEEQGELRIESSDNLLLAVKTEEDMSVLEVYVYDDSDESSLYVHHDLMLPALPLCVERLGAGPGRIGGSNFAAIGTLEPEIEVWDLDVVDGVYPAAILGALPEERSHSRAARGTGKKKRKQVARSSKFHVDAVLALAANPEHSHVLASGSADSTIKLWDVVHSSEAVRSIDYHRSKVSAVAWHPSDASVLLSGGYDSSAKVGDVRLDEAMKAVRNYTVKGDVEAVRWIPNSNDFLVASDRGVVYRFDARAESKPLWQLQAHDSDITACVLNNHFTDLLVTASSDNRIKLWNLSKGRPSMLLSRDLDVGKVFSLAFAPERENAGLLAAAGSNGQIKVWNAFANKTVRDVIAKSWDGNTRQEVIAPEPAGAGSDDDEDEDDGDEENEDDDDGGDAENGVQHIGSRQSRRQMAAAEAALAREEGGTSDNDFESGSDSNMDSE